MSPPAQAYHARAAKGPGLALRNVAVDDAGTRACRRRLAQEIGAAGVPALVTHATGGKLLRARIALLASRLGASTDPSRALRLAAAIELLHAGGLCHDDVVDGSLVRRSRPTIEATLGTRSAVVAGLWLLLCGLAALAREPRQLRRTVARALRDVARGQTDEGLELFESDLSPEAYLRRAYAKTGALYELAGRLGGEAGGLRGRALDAVASYAASLGMAFQLADDLRDLRGGATLGRDAGTDLRQGVYTLPVLLTASGRHPGADVFRRLMAQGAVSLPSCLELLRANGALSATERLAEDHVERAIAALGVFPASGARRRLETLARSMVESVGASDAAASKRIVPALGHSSALPPVPARYLCAIEGPVSVRMAFVAERCRTGLRTAVPPLAWVESAVTGAAVSILLLELADAVVDARLDPEHRPRDATLVGALDLALADLAALLADLPSAVAGTLASSLCNRVKRALVAVTSDRRSVVRLEADEMRALADEIARAATACRADAARA